MNQKEKLNEMTGKIRKIVAVHRKDRGVHRDKSRSKN